MRWTASLALALLLVACDSDGTDRSSLVGTWGLVATATVAEVTSPTAQTYIALGTPAASTVEGTFAADGGDTFELPFARRTAISSSISRYDLTSYSTLLPPDGPYQRLTLEQRADRYTAELRVVGEDGELDVFTNDAFRTVITRSGATATLEPIGVTRGPDLVQLSGEVTFDTVPLPAGVPTRVETERFTLDPGPLGVPETRFTFASDGTWRAETDRSTTTTDVDLGTWEGEDGRVRIEVPRDEGTARLTRYEFEVSGGTLALLSARDECLGALCLEARASELGLDEPITAYRRLERLEFIETDAPALRASGPAR